MTETDKNAENKNGVSRRDFVKGAAFTAASFMIVPRHVLGRGFIPPSDKLNIAGVGVGGMGRANLLNVSTENIVALCDVDWDYVNKAYTSKLDADMDRAKKGWLSLLQMKLANYSRTRLKISNGSNCCFPKPSNTRITGKC